MSELTDDALLVIDNAFRDGKALGRIEAFEEAEKIAEGSFPFDIEVWLNSTKKEMTAHVANAIASAIRARKAEQN